MSTKTTLGTVHVFPSTASYEANKSSVGENDLSLVPVSLVPSGTIIQFAGKTIPDGYLSCNGALVSRTQFADLFAAIGTTWGTGDGKTTFKLPNMHHRFLEGTTTTSEVGTYVEAGLPNISGSINPFGVACGDFVATGALSGGKSSTPWNGKTNVGSKVIDDITFNASRSNGTYGSSTTVQPSSARMTAFIKI